jgi:hypothetical protein
MTTCEKKLHLDAVLKAVEFPASVAGLNPCLTKIDRNDLTHFDKAL